MEQAFDAAKHKAVPIAPKAVPVAPTIVDKVPAAKASVK